jgi:hypothetical protein
VTVGYATPLSKRSATQRPPWRSDADNIAQRNDLAFRLGFTAAF